MLILLLLFIILLFFHLQVNGRNHPPFLTPRLAANYFMKQAPVGSVRREESRKTLLDGLITAAVWLGEVIELQKSNEERGHQLSYLYRHLREESGRRIPQDAQKLVRSHLKMVLHGQQYVEYDRRKLNEKAKDLRNTI